MAKRDNKKRPQPQKAVLLITAAAIVTALAVILFSGTLTKQIPDVPVQTSVTSDAIAPASASTAAVTVKTAAVLTAIPAVMTGDTSAETVTEPAGTKEDTTVGSEISETSAEETKEPEVTAASEASTVTEEMTAEEAVYTGETTSTVSGNPVTTAVTAASETDSYDRSFFSDDMFIGDSIYTGLYLYDFFPQSQVFAKIGLNPQSARTDSIGGGTAVERVSAMQPTRIFIMLGTNGLAYMSASYMADQMSAFVNELQSASPASRIYIVSIPPVTYAHELAGQETMAMVSAYNALLETTAGQCRAVYLDLCSRLMNESGYFSAKYAEADGLHFLGAAYRRMLSFFQSAAQQDAI